MAARDQAGKTSRRHWPLRTRLITSTVVLLATVWVLIGGMSELALGRFLTLRVDAQLTAASGRAEDFADRPSSGQSGHRDPLNAPGQAAGTLNARLTADGQVLDAGQLSSDGSRVDLASADRAVLGTIPVDGRPYSRDFSLGEFRVTAARIADGIVVTGLPLAPVHEALLGVGLILVAVALAGIVGAGLIGAFAVRRTLRPLDRVAATAVRVTELPLDGGEVALSVRVPTDDTDLGTEVGKVSTALNRMLEHIAKALEARHASETRVRQFVADASHELRTPLAAILGYAELILRSRDHLPPEVTQSMDRIREKALRMSALVDDLLLLARLDAGRPLDLAEVDLARLVADTVGDAHLTGPGHLWRLELPTDPVPVPVLADLLRLRSVLANLLGNARTHTPPGTTVTARLTTASPRPRTGSSTGTAVLTVTDDGPGIDEDLLPVVFERFGRGESGRSREAGGTGLGTAIVAAVVTAHGGTVGVRSRPGHTEFTVRLPLAPPSDRTSVEGTARRMASDAAAKTDRSATAHTPPGEGT